MGWQHLLLVNFKIRNTTLISKMVLWWLELEDSVGIRKGDLAERRTWQRIGYKDPSFILLSSHSCSRAAQTSRCLCGHPEVLSCLQICSWTHKNHMIISIPGLGWYFPLLMGNVPRQFWTCKVFKISKPSKIHDLENCFHFPWGSA